MKSSKSIFLIFGASAFLAAPLHSQFQPFVPSDTRDFTATAPNSNMSVSGEFQWQDTGGNLWLRIIIENLSNSPTGTLTSFGFETPALNSNGVAVDHVDFYNTSNSTITNVTGNWNTFQPYKLQAGLGVELEAGTGVGQNPNGGTANAGLADGYIGFFDFDFAGSGIAATNFSYDGFFGDAENPDEVLAFRFQSIDANPDSEAFFGSFISESGTPFTPVPESSTYGLFGIGVLALAIAARRIKQTKPA